MDPCGSTISNWLHTAAKCCDFAWQDEGGASRDEIAAAFLEVVAGKIPKDRIALRELHRDVMSWPFNEAAEDGSGAPSSSDASAPSPYEAITNTGDRCIYTEPRVSEVQVEFPCAVPTLHRYAVKALGLLRAGDSHRPAQR